MEYITEVLSSIDINIVKESLTRSMIYAGACTILYKLSKIISPAIIPKFHILPDDKKRDWFNKSISVLHAVMMSLLTGYYWIMINPNQIVPETVTFHQGLALDLMNGYLIYDLIYELSCGTSIEMIMHHVFGLASHYSSRFSHNGGAGFTSMLVYIAEASTPFLHVSWLLYSLEMKNTLLFTITSNLTVLLFFFCRFCLGPYMLHHMISFKHLWGEDAQGLLFWFNFIIVAIFGLMNMFWFYKLVAMKSSTSKSKSKKAD